MNKLYKACIKKMFDEDEDEELSEDELEKIAKAFSVLAEGTAESLGNGTMSLDKAATINDVLSKQGAKNAEILEAFYDLIESPELSEALYKSIGESGVILNTHNGIKNDHLIIQTENGRFWELPFAYNAKSVDFSTPIELEATFTRLESKKKAKFQTS